MPLKNAGKVCALLSSLLLGCGYVGYRHREQVEAPPTPKQDPSDPMMLPGSKNPSRITVLPGSKSIDAVLRNPQRKSTGNDFILPSLPPDEEAEKEKKRTLMPSSKLAPILDGEDAKAIDRKRIEDILDEGRRETPPP